MDGIRGTNKASFQVEEPKSNSTASRDAKIKPVERAVGNKLEVEQMNSVQEQSGYNKQPSNEMIHQAIEKVNKSMKNSSAIYGIHEGTNRVTIKIVDEKTQEVIKELPPEKTLDMIAKVWEMAGILVDEKR